MVGKGHNKFEFEVVAGWEQLPEGWSFTEVAGVAADSQDRIHVFTRGEHPVIVFDRDGKFLNAWGYGLFTKEHGIYIDDTDTIYCTDTGDHTVRIFSSEGDLIHTLGTPNAPQPTGFVAWTNPVEVSAGPFNGVANVAKAPNGDLYVADGYGNARVHVFSPSWELKFSWGEPGTGPGQFRLPHAVVVDRSGKVYIGDRENSRIQVFSGSGEYVTEWNHVSRPDDLYIDTDDNLYVAELGFKAAIVPNGWGATPPPHEPHARVSVLTLDGELQHYFGGPQPTEAGSFFAPHGIWGDSKGDIYVGELNYGVGVKQGLLPVDCHTLQKFVRLNP